MARLSDHHLKMLKNLKNLGDAILPFFYMIFKDSLKMTLFSKLL